MSLSRSGFAISQALTTVTSPVTISGVTSVRRGGGCSIVGRRQLMERRMSKSFDTGLDLLAPPCPLVDHHLLVQSSPNLNTSRLAELSHPASSLPLLLGSSATTNSSVSDFLEDPLSILRYQTLRRIQGTVTREKRLAGVTALLVSVFILCYLPFWSVYICLVRKYLKSETNPSIITQASIPSCPQPSPTALVSVQWLTLASALVNPLVYTGFNTDFREAIVQTLKDIIHIFRQKLEILSSS